MIFSGAPYFLLEKGKQDQWYPHVIFPFDDHDPTIQALWDRRALPYSSYTLSTLHAHLPIPNDWMIEGDAPIQLDSRRQTGRPKRASFDLGTFEVPNMLSMNGKEPGSVGFHYFLESPVADSVRFTGPPEVNAEAEFLRLSSLPAMEAYDLMEHRSQPYALCADGTVHDRKRLLLDGPSAWKKIGVRDIDMRHLVARLQILKDLRDETLHGEVTKTILDMEGIPYLGSGLFTNILYPPPRFMTIAGEDRHSLQSQIKALTAALATPGAWFDFNLPEWRLRIGQIIWEVSPHDGDFVDVSTCDKPWAGPSLERKWFLVQMVLAAELLLRLDAAVRVGLLRCSHDLQISEADIHDFERLRTAKVNWDMVAVRRLMDSFNFNYSPIQPEPSQSARSESSESSKKPHHFSFKNHRESASGKVLESAWTCNLIPGHVNRQLKGLLLFAENIGWPRIAELKEQFQLICQNGNSQRVNDAYNQPTQSISSTGHSKTCKNTMYSRSLSSRPLSLRYTKDPDTSGLSGWITRTWLAGLVLPGESISNILMATILENDVDAMMMLGPAANLYGGFSYHGRSWWSQECIVGRVLSSLDTNMCMGWLGSGLLPKDCRGLEPLDNTWFEVNVMDPPSCPGGPRIKQGKKISVKSTPLGVGDLTSGAFSLPVDAGDCGSKTKIDFQSLVFDVKGSSQQPKINEKHPLVARQATMVFSLGSSRRKSPGTVSFPLLYNVRFISSHECRPPGGLVLYRAPGNATKRGSSSASSSPIRRRHLPRLPGHPLHRSYTYKVISLDVLPKMPEPDSRSATGSDRALMWQEIMVLDARGGPEQEAFARAWCASVGYHAIVGRIGRTCLACCIREARAVKIRVVIRVGDGTMNGSLSNVNTRPSISS
ncbi:hypothetical protein BDW59DRAFT_54368 [Aspergillus cavernicola]|uniref:Uncharacterized protein n=1 Tax=Aspergillus cavernicola TaxID=176166 RepID=A0ABR4IIX3_9EURO